MRLSISLIFASALCAQVSVQFSPEPMEVTKALGINSRLGLWHVSMCNDGAMPVTISPERVYMASGSLSIVTPVRAAMVLSQRTKQTFRAILLEVIEYGLIAAGALGGSGLFAISEHGLAALAMATGVAHNVADRVRGDLPSLNIEDALTAPVTLPSAGCTTRSVFAAKMPKPAPFTGVIK